MPNFSIFLFTCFLDTAPPPPTHLLALMTLPSYPTLFLLEPSTPFVDPSQFTDLSLDMDLLSLPGLEMPAIFSLHNLFREGLAKRVRTGAKFIWGSSYDFCCYPRLWTFFGRGSMQLPTFARVTGEESYEERPGKVYFLKRRRS